MAEITYASIQQNIKSAQQDGGSMRCVFVCPATGTEVQSSASIHKGDNLKNRATDSVKRSLSWSIRSAVVSTLRGVLGYGIIGRVGSELAYSATSGMAAGASTSFSDEEKQAAVVRAFQNVSSQFAWDGKAGRYISAAAAAETLTDFAKQLAQAPVSQKYDRSILARMLVEVASADGRITDDERSFLAEFIAPDLGAPSELSQRASLSRAELQETSQSTRETSLMVAWALALVDKDLDDAERNQLSGHAQGLGIDAERAAELKLYAQRFIVDQALEQAYQDGQIAQAAHAEVMQLADGLGLPRDEAERVEIRFRKRNGLV